jgi:acetyl-CoA acetyltransferase
MVDLFHEGQRGFSLQVPNAFHEEMGVPHDKVNVNGGAIAVETTRSARPALILS